MMTSVLSITDLHKSFNEIEVIKGMSLEANKGDAGTIGGAYVAQFNGRLAGIVRANSGVATLPLQKRLLTLWLCLRVKQLHWARGLVDRLYRPADWLSEPSSDTIICRCEQVTAGTVTAIASIGCAGVNQLKAYTQAGRGACQGR